MTICRTHLTLVTQRDIGGSFTTQWHAFSPSIFSGVLPGGSGPSAKSEVAAIAAALALIAELSKGIDPHTNIREGSGKGPHSDSEDQS